MTRFASICLFAALSAARLAAAVDVTLFADAPAQAAVGSTLSWTLYVGNNGPDPATDVTVTTSAPDLDSQAPCGAAAHFAVIAPSAYVTIACSAQLPQTPHAISISYAATTADVDFSPNSNHFVSNVDVTNATTLAVGLSTPYAVDLGLPFRYTVSYSNRSPIAATDAAIHLTLPLGASFRHGPDFCSAVAEHLTCRVGDIAPNAGVQQTLPSFQFDVVAPAANLTQTLTTTASIASDQPDSGEGRPQTALDTRLFRAFVVTTTADSGAGSLREAINSASASCTDNYPCKISFAIAASPIDNVQTIRPATPLPHLVGQNLVVDGTTQTGYFGDSNPAGPEVQLLGDRTAEGDGLVVETSCFSQITGLSIGGFPGAAISVLDDHCATQFNYSSPSESVPLPRTIYGNYLGTDPTGSRAVPNQRGIIAGGAQVSPIRIENNVISGNLRSGIFLGDGRASYIVNNTIGLDASRKAPLGNGASGVYIGPGAYATDLFSNMIAFNHDSGVSVASGAVEITRNSIFANDQLAIDLGLDGSTAGSFELGSAVLRSAQYDPATGVTLIEGDIVGGVSGVGILPSNIDFFANDALDSSGYGEAQYVLGTGSPIGPGGSNTRHFIWSYPADLRGKFISATVTKRDYFGFAKPDPNSSWQGFVTTTSEVSRAIPVQ